MASQKGPLQKKRPLGPPGASKAAHRPLVKPQPKKKDDSSDSSKKGFLGLSVLSCCSKKDDKKKKQLPKTMPQAKKAVPVAKPPAQQKMPGPFPPPVVAPVIPKAAATTPQPRKKPLRSVEIPKDEQMKTAKPELPPPGSTKELITEDKPKSRKRSDEKVKEELKEIATARDLDEPSSRDNKRKPSKEKTPKRISRKKNEEIIPDEDTKQQTLVIKKFIRGNKAVIRWEYEEAIPLEMICDKAKKSAKSSYCCQCCNCKGNDKGKVCT